MLDIRNTTKQKPLSKEADFVVIKEAILGKKYELSLAFVGDQKSRKLNYQFRKKAYIPNILSFPLDEDSGEIFINIKKSRTEAEEFDMTPKQYIKFLFIHGCLHLTGLDHGEKMEKLEDKFSKKFL